MSTTTLRKSLPTRSLLPLILMALLFGCGGDDDGGGTATPADSQTRMRDSVSDLADRGLDTVQDPQTQLLLDERMLSPLTAMPVATPPVAVTQAIPRSWLPNTRQLVDRLYGVAWLSKARAAKAADLIYGTYVFDPENPTFPFVYWRLTNAGSPSDGFIFQFEVEDQFQVTENGVPVNYRGEIRILNVEFDTSGPSSPDDDLLTDFVYEIAAARESMPLTRFFRLPVSVGLDGSRQVVSIDVGNAGSSSPGDPAAAHLGSLVFSAGVEVSPNASAGEDIGISARVFDSVDPYVLGLSLDAVGLDAVTGSVQSVTVVLEWGAALDPNAAPWQLETLLDNFRDHPTLPEEMVMDIGGQIRESGTPIATFDGSSLEVPVDVDGDPATEETCLDVDIRFTGQEPVNICVFFAGLLDAFDGTIAAALLPLD